MKERAVAGGRPRSDEGFPFLPTEEGWKQVESGLRVQAGRRSSMEFPGGVRTAPV